jgi:hypothetical protein
MMSNGLSYTGGKALASSRMGLAFGYSPASLDRMAVPRQLSVDELTLRHLHTPDDFDAVRGLRAHIDLSAHAAVDPRFEEHEKKEMN